jgi:hypothetical protein
MLGDWFGFVSLGKTNVGKPIISKLSVFFAAFVGLDLVQRKRYSCCVNILLVMTSYVT